MSSVVVICCLFLPLFGLHSPLLPKRVRKGCAEPMKRPSASSSMLKKPAKSLKKPSRTAEGAAGVKHSGKDCKAYLWPEPGSKAASAKHNIL